MASPGYDAKYRRHDDAPGRVIPAPLLHPDAAAAELQPETCSGELVVGDEQYEPWGTPHGGVIAELAAGCMALQGLVALGCERPPLLLTSHHQFRRRWVRGERLHWTTRVVGQGRALPESPSLSDNTASTCISSCVIEVEMSMGAGVVTRSTGTVIATSGEAEPTSADNDRRVREAACAAAERLPRADALHLPTHHAGWTAGSIEGHFETAPASLFVALDEVGVLATAASRVETDLAGSTDDAYMALSSLAYAYWRMALTAAESEQVDPDVAAKLEEWNDLLSYVYQKRSDDPRFRSALREAAQDLESRTPSRAFRPAEGLLSRLGRAREQLGDVRVIPQTHPIYGVP